MVCSKITTVVLELLHALCGSFDAVNDVVDNQGSIRWAFLMALKCLFGLGTVHIDDLGILLFLS